MNPLFELACWRMGNDVFLQWADALTGRLLTPKIHFCLN